MPIQSWLARANRTGTFTTSARTVPSNLTGIYWVRTNVLASQLTDTTRNFSVTIEITEDGGQTWRVYMVLEWVGCPIWKGGGNPGWVLDASELAGKTIRVTITVSRQTNIGMDIETV